MSIPLKISIACNIVLFSSSVYFYTGTIDRSEDFASYDSTQPEKKRTKEQKRREKREKRRERVAKKMQKTGEGKHSVSPSRTDFSSETP